MSPLRLFQIVVRDFVSLFYPHYCLGCSNSLVKGETFVCTRCMLEMPQTGFHQTADNPLKLRLSSRIDLVYALGFFKFTKKGRIQHILHSLKYRNQPEVGVVLGKAYGMKLKEAGLQFDCVVPVPLHPSRQRKRGYNQSAKFAQGLSESLNIPAVESLVERVTKTQTQTRKTKLERWENVSEVFHVVSTGVCGQHILLVDDVITTGATVEACAMAITQNINCRVSVAAIAVA